MKNIHWGHSPLKKLFFKERKQSHPVIYRRITVEMARKAATETKGAAGPYSMDVNTWWKLLTAKKFITDNGH